LKRVDTRGHTAERIIRILTGEKKGKMQDLTPIINFLEKDKRVKFAQNAKTQDLPPEGAYP
jgi:hypothetical protein